MNTCWQQLLNLFMVQNNFGQNLQVCILAVSVSPVPNKEPDQDVGQSSM